MVHRICRNCSCRSNCTCVWKDWIGAATFWFGLITLIPLLVIVIKRYAVHPLPEPVKPLSGIFAAPMSLCIAAYIQSVQVKNFTLLMAMFVVATVLYVYSLVVSLGLLKKFYPSFAGFTFPFVISAIATKQTMACSALMGHPLPWLSNIVLAETVIATAFVALCMLSIWCLYLLGMQVMKVNNVDESISGNARQKVRK